MTDPDTRRRVLDALATHPRADRRAANLAASLGVPLSEVVTVLEDLMAAKLVYIHGRSRALQPHLRVWTLSHAGQRAHAMLAKWGTNWRLREAEAKEAPKPAAAGADDALQVNGQAPTATAAPCQARGFLRLHVDPAHLAALAADARERVRRLDPTPMAVDSFTLLFLLDAAGAEVPW